MRGTIYSYKLFLNVTIKNIYYLKKIKNIDERLYYMKLYKCKMFKRLIDTY